MIINVAAALNCELFLRSENCGKFSPANKSQHNIQPIHQSPMLRVTMDAIGQCGLDNEA